MPGVHETGSVVRYLLNDTDPEETKKIAAQGNIIISLGQCLNYLSDQEGEDDFNVIGEGPDREFIFGRYSAWYDDKTKAALKAMDKGTLHDVPDELKALAQMIKEDREIMESVCYFVEKPDTKRNGREVLFQAVVYPSEIVYVDYYPGKWEVQLHMLNHKMMKETE